MHMLTSVYCLAYVCTLLLLYMIVIIVEIYINIFSVMPLMNDVQLQLLRYYCHTIKCIVDYIQ